MRPTSKTSNSLLVQYKTLNYCLARIACMMAVIGYIMHSNEPAIQLSFYSYSMGLTRIKTRYIHDSTVLCTLHESQTTECKSSNPQCLYTILESAESNFKKLVKKAKRMLIVRNKIRPRQQKI